MSIATDKKELFHTFSKQPVANGYTLDQATNKAGHIVTKKDVWADDIPAFVELNYFSEITTKFPNPEKNDLILILNDGASNGLYYYNSTSLTWVKHPKQLSDGAEYANKNDKLVVRYYQKKPLTLIVGNLNVPPTADRQAWRLFPYLSNPTLPLNQYIDVTNRYTKTAYPSTGYAPKVYSKTADVAPMGAGDYWYIDAFSGIIMFDPNNSNAVDTMVISCWEYFGDTLETQAPPVTSTIEVIERVLTTGEKQSGVIYIPTAITVVNILIADKQLFIPLEYPVEGGVKLLLWDIDAGETAANVYDGALSTGQITYTYYTQNI